MEKTLLTREELAERWGLNVRTIIKYEQDGVISRNPNITAPRYHILEIEKLEGAKLNRFSPIERKQMEEKIEVLKKENKKLRDLIFNILSQCSAVIPDIDK